VHASAIAIVTIVLSGPLAAQWLTYQTPGIPRTPEGKPNLSAPTPRTPDGTPDLSGLFATSSTLFSGLSGLGVEFIEGGAGRALCEARLGRLPVRTKVEC
jgi:hypothetical protein